MEASRVDELVSRAMDEQVAEYRQWRDEAAALAERIERLEAAVDALRAEVAGGVTEAARLGVAGEVDRLADDLRRQISDLGRLIVNDLGRLPKLLEQQQPAPPTAATPATEEAALDLRDDALPYADAAEERRGLFRRR
ncbi:MAG TPA: hypothetical protein VFK42_12290 [Acidimicrobiales bacterium]|jgi:hypothetical protein|nr:hypothetical protein [Acidimicrobiales bacterium]